MDYVAVIGVFIVFNPQTDLAAAALDSIDVYMEKIHHKTVLGIKLTHSCGDILIVTGRRILFQFGRLEIINFVFLLSSIHVNPPFRNNSVALFISGFLMKERKESFRYA
jgi:hypothetical protein